jgi:hypothetical protein
MTKLLIAGNARITEGKLASILGINESIILHQVHFWTTENKNHQRISYRKEGFWWTWNTMAKWQEEFPWLNAKKIERCLASLKRHGVLIGKCLSENKLNRTLWYRIDYKRLEAFIGAFDNGVACNLQKEQDDLYTKKTFRSSKLQPARSNPTRTEQRAASSSPSGEVVQSDLTQGEKWVAGTATYPDKLLSQPVLNPDKSSEDAQPTLRFFEFENSFSPEEGLVPLWGDDGLEFVPIAQIEPNHIPDTSKMVETIAQPEPPGLQDRIRKQKRVPPPASAALDDSVAGCQDRDESLIGIESAQIVPRKVCKPKPRRKMSREAQLYAYRYDKAGWLHLPPATGINSQARAITVRAMQETILQDYGGRGLAAEWEYDDDTDSWRVVDHKSCGEELTMEEALSKRGRLPLKALRNYAVTFAGLDQETFNTGLQKLYETALEYIQKHGRQDILEEGERWIDQPIFDDYLGDWRESA